MDDVLQQAISLRQQLATEVNDGDPQRSANTKRRQWRRYQELTAELKETADAIVATGLKLGGKPGRALNVAYENLSIALGQAHPGHGDTPSRTMLDEILRSGLTPAVPTDYDHWKPLHWILAVPDVMERGGFDAIIGNPPFLGGQKLTGAMGTNIRDWFINVLANGKKGSADLVAYFFLRAMALLNQQGDLGLVATNTVAQGDTREVGLDQMAQSGFKITRAIQSRSWPVASANLEFAAVWGSRAKVAPSVPRVSDGVPVTQISTLLEPGNNMNPRRLTENAGIAFQGCIVLGKGFVIDNPAEAENWVEADPINAEVLFPYLNGEDLNSRPGAFASRLVIDFNDRSEGEARRYWLVYRRVLECVKPDRAKKSKAVRESPWWLFLRSRPAMRKAIAGLNEVLVIALVSKTVMPMRVTTGQVFSHKLAVFATDSYVDQAVLSSSLHQMWAIKYGATMRADVNYSPSDVFLTFASPASTASLALVGQTLDAERREIMLRRDLGLTKLYNLVNDPDVTSTTDSDIARMREIHVELDRAMMDAYGWNDVPLDHGFHTYRQMQRWTVSPVARVEILDRLLADNLRRAEAQGEVPVPAEDDEEDDE